MIKAIITGATGMVGEGVLHECLQHNQVEEVLVIGRKNCGVTHAKLKEIIINDFFTIDQIEDQLSGYNACFFCIGVSSVGMKADDYYRYTYTLTMSFAQILCKLNPDMTFCYISGAGTDSSEKGRIRWAKVKGKTENDLVKLPFRQVYNFRPALIIPAFPPKPSHTYYKTYKYSSWLIPVIKFLAPNYISSLQEVALAMVNAALFGYSKNVLEVNDIKSLAKRAVL